MCYALFDSHVYGECLKSALFQINSPNLQCDEAIKEIKTIYFRGLPIYASIVVAGIWEVRRSKPDDFPYPVSKSMLSKEKSALTNLFFTAFGIMLVVSMIFFLYPQFVLIGK